MYTFFMNIRPAICILAALLIISCTGRGENDLERENLFSLDYGKMEDQLDLVQSPGSPFDTNTAIVMKNGFFYILNRTAGKLMKFNSYGDIVELYYNQDKNPDPVLLERESGNETQSTKRAFEYPFEDIRNFAVSSGEYLFVDDRVPEARREYDGEMDAMLDRIVLRFDRNGRLLDYIGQEGIGGTPFSYIDRIDIDIRDEIIVTTRNMRSWRVFWYTAEGRLISTIEIPLATLPVPADTDYTVSLESIMPDTRARTLYLKVDYYGTGETGDYGYISSAILVLHAETGIYSDTVPIPVHYRESEEPAGFSDDRVKMLYELLGVAEGQFFFLMSPEDGPYYRLLIIDRTGVVHKRVRIELANGSLYYRDMCVSFDGILSALLCLENSIEVVWWRSDRFLGGIEE